MLKYLEVLSIEWQRSTNKCIQNNTKTPDINFRTIIFLACTINTV